MYCRYCGKPMDENATFCRNCGRNQDLPGRGGTGNAAQQTPYPPQASAPQEEYKPVLAFPTSRKNRWVALVLLLLLGWAGGHKFYTGRIGGAFVLLALSVFGGVSLSMGLGYTPIETTPGTEASPELLALTALVLACILLFIAFLILLVNFIQILTGNFQDDDGLPLK